MKKIFVLPVIMLFCMKSFSQGVAINNNGAPADASSLLDISSHDKGVLIPRLRTIERTAIVNPAYGLLVYDIDTRSFWYYDLGVWKEILNSGAMILPTGPASGDLYGSYPSPNVGKIQNLDVAFGVPFDKQVMKWDALNNRWQGLNDSLFLPYNATFGSATKLFGITNTNTSNGATAVYGKSGNTGAGITPSSTVGVWGDNSTGAGVVGTSNTGIGTFGFSFQNHGVYGYTTNNAFAGVYGSHANNGAGVMGEVSGAAVGVYGRATGTMGKAGVFETNNSSNADTVLYTKNAGFGSAAIFVNTNSINGNPVVAAVSNAIGDGYYAEMNNTTNTANAAFRGINNSLGGYGMYAESVLGRSGYFFNSANTNNQPAIDVKTNGLSTAGSFTIANSNNTNYILQGTTNGTGGGISLSLTNTVATGVGFNLTHNGTGNGIVAAVRKGKAAVFSNTDATNTLTVLDVTNIGTGNAASFVTNSATNSSAVVSVNTNGTGRGLQSTISNSANLAAAVYGSSSGNKGVEGIALNQGVTGQSTALSSGIGVFGQSSLNSANGIGVEGVSYSTFHNVGSVTGINSSDGIAVYGSSANTGGNGIGVYGVSSGTNGKGVSGEATSGIGIYGFATTGDAIYGYTSAGGTGVVGFSNGGSAVGISGLAAPTSGQGAGISGSCSGIGDGVDGHAGTSGYGIYGDAVFDGLAGVFGEGAGSSYGVKGSNSSSTKAAILGVNSSGDGVTGTSNGNGYGIHGIAGPSGATGAGVYGSTNPISSTGRAALFETIASNNTYDAVMVNNAGLGATIDLKSTNSSNNVTMVRVTKTGTVGDYIIFEDGVGNNKIRFNDAGKGFFDGGTQSGGADMAEAFDVVDDIKNYEPGDVLIISTDKDRAVEKSNGAYSDLVAGVYATKPGMLMTEENIDADLSGKVPMGVVGVIPTKVCLEGGEIRRGDMLVTSSQPGVAMKADPEKLRTGQVIGKALENYTAHVNGKIKVLVNVK